MSSFRGPFDRLGLNRIGRAFARVDPAAPGQPADDFHGHIVIANNLAAKPYAGEAPCRQHRLLRRRHFIRLARNELDTAGRAPSVAAARVQLVHFGFVLKRQHKALFGWNVELPDILDGQDRHGASFRGAELPEGRVRWA